jgi:hypothetical protein
MVAVVSNSQPVIVVDRFDPVRSSLTWRWWDAEAECGVKSLQASQEELLVRRSMPDRKRGEIRLALDLPAHPHVARGDRIFVPSLGCFQPELVRPSPVTSPGVRVFMSNLSRPAASNASSAIGKDSTSLPYGTRLLQGLVAANCVGGSNLNAQRSAVLISRNPINGRSVVIARQIETLVRDSDRDDADPYLMPGDAIACYDSKAMTLVDAISLVGNALTPVALYKNLHL